MYPLKMLIEIVNCCVNCQWGNYLKCCILKLTWLVQEVTYPLYALKYGH